MVPAAAPCVSRRWYAPSTILDVGAGIPDGPGRNVPWTRQGCRVLRNGYAFAPMRRSTSSAAARRHTQVPPYEHRRTAPHGSGRVRHRTRYDIRPPSTTRVGGGDGGLRLCRGLRHLRMALWDAGGISRRARRGNFARCDGREFRPLRRATGGAAPWTPAIF